MVKKYNDFNTNKIKYAANSFEDFFKLMNNSVYGKALWKLRERINIKLVNNSKVYKKYVSKPILVSQKMFNKNFVAIQEIKPVLKFDKPIYEGFSVLDLSKLLMYKFHYKYTEKKLLLVYYLQT